VAVQRHLRTLQHDGGRPPSSAPATRDGLIATATRPALARKFEIESADDFAITSATSITSATFTGLVTTATPGTAPTVGQVVVEIYGVFPNLLDVGRTSGSPIFSTLQVPTRVNSRSDVEWDDRSTSGRNLTFQTKDLGAFAALNSVQPGGIHPIPNQTTGGNGPVTDEEIQFNVNFTTPFSLPADPGYFFFVPQVTAGEFLCALGAEADRAVGYAVSARWDLQSWTRDEISPVTLAPDWLRVGQDIVGGSPFPTFNLLAHRCRDRPRTRQSIAAWNSACRMGLLRRRHRRRASLSACA
jgi:hypothetical protein